VAGGLLGTADELVGNAGTWDMMRVAVARVVVVVLVMASQILVLPLVLHAGTAGRMAERRLAIADGLIGNAGTRGMIRLLVLTSDVLVHAALLQAGIVGDTTGRLLDSTGGFVGSCAETRLVGGLLILSVMRRSHIE